MDNILVVSSWTLLIYICLNFGSCAEYKFDVTVFDNSPLVGTSSSEEYRVYVPWDQKDATVDEIGRWGNTGTGELGTGYHNPPHGGIALNGSGLPNGSNIVIRPSSNNWERTEVKFPSSSSVQRVGVFYARTSRGDYSLKIPILKMREDATIKPTDYTKTIGIGESVTLSVETVQGIHWNTLRWVHNNAGIIEAWNGLSEVTIDNARMADGGIYECFEDGKRGTGEHAIMRLIVRECPSAKYGPDCSNNCTTCWNGGICAADNGVCLCQPGFRGEECEERLGNNNWGALGTFYCSSGRGNCSAALICGPDPIGCSCAAGYTGLDCNTECPNSWYGSSCKRQCHCDTGSCISDKGCASGASCWPGYSEEFCQGKLVCDDSSFGAQCEFPCHCEGGGGCNKTTGECDSGVCAYGWGGVDCQQALPYFFDVKAATANSSATTINITWNAWNQSIDYGTGPVEYYKIYYWRTTSTDRHIYKTYPNAFASVSDLDPETSYTFEVAAVKRVLGSDLEGPRTLETSATTGCGAPVLAPTITEVTQIVEDKAMLNWMIPGGLDWTQCSQGLDGFVILRQNDDMTATIPVNDPTLKSFEIDSLSPCSRHEFSIKATNKDAEGNFSSTESITILVTPGMAKDISYTDGILEWSEPESICVILNYVVNVDLINTDQCDEKTEAVLFDHHVENPMIALPSLQHFSTYVVIIQARTGSNSFGIGEPARMEFTTEESVPSGEPRNIKVVSQTSNQIVVSWEPPVCRSRHGSIIMYEYEFWVSGGTDFQKFNTTNTIVILTHLLDDKLYIFQVRAYTAKGPGPYSRPQLLNSSTKDCNTGVIIGTSVAAVIIIVFVAAIFVYRFRACKVVSSQSVKEVPTPATDSEDPAYELNTRKVNVHIATDNSANFTPGDYETPEDTTERSRPPPHVYQNIAMSGEVAVQSDKKDSSPGSEQPYEELNKNTMDKSHLYQELG